MYNPGYGGNFLVRLFSLGPETCPQLPIDLLSEYEIIPDLDISQRLQLYSFKNVKTNFSHWQSFHRSWVDFLNHGEMFNKRNEKHRVTFFSMHHPEMCLQLSNIKTLEGKIVGTDLDLNLYKGWLDKSQKELLFKFRLDEFENYINWLPEVDNKISLTEILTGVDNFVFEYEKFCKIFEIESHVDSALTLYKDWVDVRVKGYV